jgi:hypothetical protein
MSTTPVWIALAVAAAVLLFLWKFTGWVDCRLAAREAAAAARARELAEIGARRAAERALPRRRRPRHLR